MPLPASKVAVAFLDLWPHPSKLCLPGHTVSSPAVCAKSLLAFLLKGAWLGFRAHSDTPGTVPHLKIFTQSHLQKPFFQNREHSQAPGVRTWAYIVGGGSIQPSSQAKLSPLTRSPPWSHFLNLRGQFPVLSQTIFAACPGLCLVQKNQSVHCFPKVGPRGTSPPR